MKGAKTSNLGPPPPPSFPPPLVELSRRYYARSRPLYCENEKRGTTIESFVDARYIRRRGGDNYVERGFDDRGSLSTASRLFLITVFHLKNRRTWPYRGTSCISLFMYEKCFKAARESTGAKIRVAISKPSFPSSLSP